MHYKMHHRLTPLTPNSGYVFQPKLLRLIILVYLFGWIIGKSSGWKIRWRIPIQAIISSTSLHSLEYANEHRESIDWANITQITHNWMVINDIYIYTQQERLLDRIVTLFIKVLSLHCYTLHKTSVTKYIERIKILHVLF